MKKFRLIKKRECYRLTYRAWMIITAVIVLCFYLFMRNIVGFLSAAEPTDARVMVVEGYLHDETLGEVIRIFREGNYELMVCTGPSYEQGFYITGVRSAAELTGRSLLKLGLDSTKLAMVPISPQVYRDRTYHSALATRHFLEEQHPEYKKINLLSQSVHARRSHYLFKKAYEPAYETGNIVIPVESVRPHDWYKSSRGFRSVINETIAYLYVVLFFHPGQDKEH